jgi:hypothetical protein
LDTEILVSQRFLVGAELVRFLDEHQFDVEAAFWLLESEDAEWRLVLATPLVDHIGPREAYERLRALLEEMPQRVIAIRDVTLTSPRDSLVRLMKVAIRTGPGVSGIRFSKNTVNGHYFHDAYIYRV